MARRHTIYLRGSALSLVFVLFAAGCAAVETRELRLGEAVLFASVANAKESDIAILGGVTGRLLNDAPGGRKVAVVSLSAHDEWVLPDNRYGSVEFFVIAGGVTWNQQQFEASDYLRIPAGAQAVPMLVGEDGVQVLVFVDPPDDRSGSDDAVTVSFDSPAQWRPGIAAKKDTGTALKLEVRDLYFEPSSGQRTWLVRAGPDLTVPWEVHEAVEEGYLVAGDYYLGECLPQGPVYGEYQPGGYFYRPGGWVHSGPESGSQTGVVWLMRTPSTLTVEFLPGCPDQP